VWSPARTALEKKLGDLPRGETWWKIGRVLWKAGLTISHNACVSIWEPHLMFLI
jgi:hypothetical protein